MQLQELARLFGMAFLVLFSATVAFLIWNQVSPVAEPAASPVVVTLPVEIRVAKQEPDPEPVPSPSGLDLSENAGSLRAGVDPSLDLSDGQGALELSGPQDVSIDVDGVKRGALPLTLALDGGVHRVRYRNGAVFTDRFYYVKPGATRVLRVVTQAGGFVDAR